MLETIVKALVYFQHMECHLVGKVAVQQTIR